MGYSGEPQELPGIVANLAERLRALEARFLVQGPTGPSGPAGPGSIVQSSWQRIGFHTVTALESPVASLEFLIPTGFNHLVGFYKARSSAAVTNQALGARFNSDSGPNYYIEPLYATDTAISSGGAAGNSSLQVGLVTGTTATAGVFAAGRIDFPNCSDSLPKFALSLSAGPTTLLGTGQESQLGVGWWSGTDPIGRLLILPGAGGLITGSSVWVYGIV
jgi:hypothetical protein